MAEHGTDSSALYMHLWRTNSLSTLGLLMLMLEIHLTIKLLKCFNSNVLFLYYIKISCSVTVDSGITDTSDPRHFGTSLVGPNCPDRSALVPKCPKDSSDLSAELSCPKCRTVPSQVPKCLGPCLTTTRCNRPEGQINGDSTCGITL